MIVQHDHYIGPIASFESHDKLTFQEWNLITLETNAFAKKRLLLKVKHGSDQSFGLIAGSELLVHRKGGQTTLFDPKTDQEVSKSFSNAYLFNRSGTFCLTLTNVQTTILDTLSSREGEAKVLAQPKWAEVLKRRERESLVAVLTDDAQYIVIWPFFGAPSFVEAWSTNGDKEGWSIPPQRRGDHFVDADVINGKVVILAARRLENGVEDELKLINMKGETLHSVTIPTSSDLYWDSSRHEILIACGYDKSSFELWNYESNAMSDISFLHVFRTKSRGR